MNAEQHSSSRVEDYRHIAEELLYIHIENNQTIRLRVVSESMAPTLSMGDYIQVVGADFTKLHRGDLVVIRREQDILTHRILEVGSTDVLSKGDQSIDPDPLFPLESILGVVTEVEKKGMVIDLYSRRWVLINRFLGWLGWEEYNLWCIAKRLWSYKLPLDDKETIVKYARILTLPFRLLRNLVLTINRIV